MKLFGYKWFKKKNQWMAYLTQAASLGLIGGLLWLIYFLTKTKGYITDTLPRDVLALWGVAFALVVSLFIIFNNISERAKLSDRIERLEEQK